MPVMKYPKEVIAIGKTKLEARILLGKGKFAKYNYEDIKSGKKTAKFSVILQDQSGKQEHYMMIPLKGKYLAIPMKGGKVLRKAWNPKMKKIENLF